jgi:hypothetical protein
MRFRLPLLLSALLLVHAGAALAGDDLKIQVLDQPITDLRAYADALQASVATTTGPAGSAALAQRSAGGTSDVLLVPYYESDRRNPSGIDTLFAVHNETGESLPIRILYLTRAGATQQKVQEITLGPRATETINLRDVPGLEVDSDGVARGLVILGVVGPAHKATSNLLSGDYFHLDPRTGVSTGGNLANLSLDDPGNELCSEWSTRFFNGGSFKGRTEYRAVVDVPQGSADYDNPTAIGTVFDESGKPIQSFEIRTDLHSFRLPAAELVPDGMAFGSLEIRFLSTKGLLLTEHSGLDRLSVSLAAACRDDVE